MSDERGGAYELPGFREQLRRLGRDLGLIGRTAVKAAEVKRDIFPKIKLDEEKHSVEKVGTSLYQCSLATMCGEKLAVSQYRRSSYNNDRAYYGVNQDGKLYVYVADGVDGAGAWGGVMAEMLFRAVWQYGLTIDSLKRGADAVSGKLKEENATLESGSTFSGLTVDGERNLRVLHTGDSKIYWYDAKKKRLTRLTHDYDAKHERARILMEENENLTRAQALQMAEEQGFHDNELTRMVKATDEKGTLVGKPQAFRDKDYEEGVFFAVTDGVEKYLSENELKQVVEGALDSKDPDLAGAVVRKAYESAKRSGKKRLDAITAVAVVVPRRANLF